MKISRREFVRWAGILGGVGAAHLAMEALGVAPVLVSYAGPPSLLPESGKGIEIVILGAGIAGLTIIPHTFTHTTLGSARVGSRLNVEVDVLAKHVEKLLKSTTD